MDILNTCRPVRSKLLPVEPLLAAARVAMRWKIPGLTSRLKPDLLSSPSPSLFATVGRRPSTKSS